MPRPELLCIMGPTAAGKTALAVAIAEARNCELISVDSALVYRGMDIGTAKPDYPHHLIDIRDPSQPYSAAEFCRDAREAIEAVTAAGKTPVLVGGTMLYFKALLDGLADMPAADPSIRDHLAQEAAEKGWPHLHRMLSEVDPTLAKQIHPNHSQRIGRALEVYLASGVTMTAWRERQLQAEGGSLRDRYSLRQIAIRPAQRSDLHQRIARRVDAMFDAGLEAEVRALHQRSDLHPDLPAVRAVGYRQLWGYLDGEYDLDRARELCVQATRQLAKRQLTWLRGWPDLLWLLTDAQGESLADAPTLSPAAAALKYLDTVAN
ncbi:MAG: tRNA (adenosine(37)-N6)-dimethylallyltransferase MiaA [Halieaceae bacterium]|jgi:tRNA dimethylallyltransferase|nr:tRNA (adenosine(37)-N6)-dimethylallyltransferase MiaA [Halieaceae bacterium]